MKDAGHNEHCLTTEGLRGFHTHITSYPHHPIPIPTSSHHPILTSSHTHITSYAHYPLHIHIKVHVHVYSLCSYSHSYTHTAILSFPYPHSPRHPYSHSHTHTNILSLLYPILPDTHTHIPALWFRHVLQVPHSQLGECGGQRTCYEELALQKIPTEGGSGGGGGGGQGGEGTKCYHNNYKSINTCTRIHCTSTCK